jgi:hypothetical protein
MHAAPNRGEPCIVESPRRAAGRPITQSVVQELLKKPRSGLSTWRGLNDTLQSKHPLAQQGPRIPGVDPLQSIQSRKRVPLPGASADDGDGATSGVLDLEGETTVNIFMANDGAWPSATAAHDYGSLDSISNGSRLERSMSTTAPDSAHQASTRSIEELPTNQASGRDIQTLRQLTQPMRRAAMVAFADVLNCRNTPHGPSSRAIKNDIR